MGKLKNRSHSETHYLKGQIKELEKQNRNLKKRIRQLEKQEHMFEEALMSDEPIEFDIAPLEQTCPHCGKGKLKHLNILDRIFEECNICDHRRKVSGP